ncbi:TPA: hypothetical protein N0F65_001703 [Lagenidium giganteum]|uniref:PAP-associated domain-containing protein n=1 Tax=Lagenidium giganteum TaxID=4803 RepID=A0AAV2YLT1_9STRA|nr:TPA: hypothetical protein N0F65_001703 [Lagenidium giganteum]
MEMGGLGSGLGGGLGSGLGSGLGMDMDMSMRLNLSAGPSAFPSAPQPQYPPQHMVSPRVLQQHFPDATLLHPSAFPPQERGFPPFQRDQYDFAPQPQRSMDLQTGSFDLSRAFSAMHMHQGVNDVNSGGFPSLSQLSEPPSSTHSSASSASWDSSGALMREQMNQQMAALYRRGEMQQQHQQPPSSGGRGHMGLRHGGNGSDGHFSADGLLGSLWTAPHEAPSRVPLSGPPSGPRSNGRSPGKPGFARDRERPRSERRSDGVPSSSSDSGSSVQVSPEVVNPNENIKVQVSLLSDECIPGRILVVGLFRLGQPTNDKPIFVKQVLFENKLNKNYRFVNTRITFRAPRSPGEFEFRVFEQLYDKDRRGKVGDDRNNGDDGGDATGGRMYSNATIARSNKLKVIMEYSYFIDMLRGVQEKFAHGRDEGDAGAVLSSMISLLRLVEQVETVFLHGHLLLGDVLEEYFTLLAVRPATIMRNFKPSDSIPNPLETFHGTMRNLLNAIQMNRFLKEFIAADVLQKIEAFQTNYYCAVSGLFFLSAEEKAAFWTENFGFAPLVFGDAVTREDLFQSPFVKDLVSEWVWNEAKQLIPDKQEFRSVRQHIYELLHDQVVSRLGVQATLDVFGSSANEFGTATSDMDMCLVLKSPTTLEEKQQILQDVVILLERRPDLFTDIDTARLTARIPIVMFKMKESGIECDLCVENMLAQRNTSFLRAYANADPRVRPLAYVIKQFVKRRRMNCAAEGTLSSYGYLLMLIHFLQRQEPPILPVLQVLGPDWQGDRKCNCTASAVWCRAKSPTCQLTERQDEMGLPSVISRGPEGENNNAGDGTNLYETYFYDPFAHADAADRLGLLEAFGRQNGISIGELLLRFLEYFGLLFDSSNEVVTVRMGRMLSKEEKKETSKWRMHTRLSIEDPFEVSYDVAHVLKGSRDKYIRQQFARAYSLLASAALSHLKTSSGSDDTSGRELVQQTMTEIFDQVHEVPFLASQTQAPLSLAGLDLGMPLSNNSLSLM